MASRRSSVRRGKRPVIASEAERRSKHRSEASSQGTSSPPVEHPRVSISCANRSVTTGRKVDFDFLESEGFEIGHRIRAQGWEFVCSLELPTYPVLVREFYSTAGRGSGGLVGNVRGVDIIVSEEALARILSLPREGTAPTWHGERESALNLILGRDDCSRLDEVYANSLSVEMRLLLSIVNRVLFPKTGRFDFISERDLIVMQSILEEIPLNLPQMMINYMGEAVSKPRLSLPYGMVFTLLFREYGVVISDDEPKKNLRYTDFYGASSLHRMGFQKVRGEWVKKSSGQRDEAGPSHPTSSSPHADIPPHIPDILSSPSRTTFSAPPSVPIPPPSDQPFRLPEDQLRLLASLIAAENRDHLERVHSSITDALSDLSLRVSSLEQSLPRRYESLTDELRAISERLSVIEVSGLQDISHEMGVLRGRIERASAQVEAALNEFSSSQGEHFVRVLAALERLIAHFGPGGAGPSGAGPGRR